MGFPSRFNKFGKRKSLNYRPEPWHTIQTLCPHRCGGVMRIDKYRNSGTEMKDKKLCYSDCFIGTNGYNYPHQWGSKGCKYRDDKVLDMAIEGKEHTLVDPDEPCPF